MVSNAKDKLQDCDTIQDHLFQKLCSDKSPCSNKLSKVRRNLFGIGVEKSEDDYSQFLNEHLSGLAEEATREWNFDFRKELPQPGRYVWQRLRGYEVPVWYAAVSKLPMKEISLDNQKSTNENFMLPGSETSFRFSASKDTRTEQPSKKPRLVQTTMKDFSRVKKRRYSHRLKLKQVQQYSCKLRNHHLQSLTVHSRAVLV